MDIQTILTEAQNLHKDLYAYLQQENDKIKQEYIKFYQAIQVDIMISIQELYSLIKDSFNDTQNTTFYSSDTSQTDINSEGIKDKFNILLSLDGTAMDPQLLGEIRKIYENISEKIKISSGQVTEKDKIQKLIELFTTIEEEKKEKLKEIDNNQIDMNIGKIFKENPDISTPVVQFQTQSEDTGGYKDPNKSQTPAIHQIDQDTSLTPQINQNTPEDPANTAANTAETKTNPWFIGIGVVGSFVGGTTLVYKELKRKKKLKDSKKRKKNKEEEEENNEDHEAEGNATNKTELKKAIEKIKKSQLLGKQKDKINRKKTEKAIRKPDTLTLSNKVSPAAA